MFFKCEGNLYPLGDIHKVSLDEVEKLQVNITMSRFGERLILRETEAVDFLYKYYPSALEGRRLKWAKNAWFFHNMVGHPLMQLLSLLRCYRWAMAVHDRTIPRPKPIPKENKDE